jgi:hypothetical protein
MRRFLPLLGALGAVVAFVVSGTGSAVAATPKSSFVTLHLKVKKTGKTLVSIPLRILQYPADNPASKPFYVAMHMRKRPHFTLPKATEAVSAVRVTYRTTCDGKLSGLRVLNLFPDFAPKTSFTSFAVRDDHVRTCDGRYNTLATATVTMQVRLRGKLYASGTVKTLYDIQSTYVPA